MTCHQQGRFTLVGRVLAIALLLTLGTISANAYTLVMRDGRRVQIPDQFTVTNSTLTYEVGSGIQITVQLSGVNIAATERANGEAVGALRARATSPNVVTNQVAQTRTTANRSITNRDLEGFRRARLDSEKAYEKRRRELGLPSMEEGRRELAAVEDRTHQQLLNTRGQNEAPETYWRNRASSLRTELAANNAQIEFVRTRLNELPPSNSFGTLTTTNPFGIPVINGPFGYPVNNDPFYNPRRRDRRRWNRFPQTVLTVPYESNDTSFERSTLVNQLNELLMQRAALSVRWREFEEEARRAGAYPGWLR